LLTKMNYAAARSTGLSISADTCAALGAGVVMGVDEGGGGVHFACWIGLKTSRVLCMVCCWICSSELSLLIAELLEEEEEEEEG
jgi:hypothetical protein